MARELKLRHSPAALIVGFEANGLGVARALARAGIPCLALAQPGHTPFSRTNTCEVVYAKAWTAEALVSDLKRLAARFAGKPPLLLTKDQAVLWVSQARHELQELFEIVLPNKGTIELLMSKQAFAKLAQQENWPVPLTWDIDSRQELEAHLPNFVYPCILKPRIKNDQFRLHAPSKAFRVQNQDALLTTYDLVAQWEPQVIVQEWIEGGDDRIAFCLGYCDRDSTPRVLFAGRKLLQWPLQFGNTAVCAPAPENWQEPILSLTRRIWARLGYQGLGSIEFKMRLGTDVPVLIEPTVGRTDYQSELAVLNGANIPAIAYCDMAKVTYAAVPQPQPCIKLVDGAAHLRAGWLSCFHPRRLRPAEWLRLRKGTKRFMVWRPEDPGPFFASVWVGIRGKLGDLGELLLGRNLKTRLTSGWRSLSSKAPWNGAKAHPRESR